LTKLDVRQNAIHGAKAGKAFADMLTQNTALKELDLSSQAWSTHNGLDAAFAKEFAVGLSNNGTLSSLNFAENSLCGLDKYGRGAFDASGHTSPLYAHIPLLTLDCPHLCQVLSPLSMPSPIWGRFRH
jgi:hypothetical protein